MKKEKQTAIIILTSVVLGSVFFSFPKIALADAVSLKVSPSVLRIQAKPPADVWTPFVIQNPTDQPVNLNVGYKPFDPQASQNGKVVFLKNGQQIQGIDKNIFEKMQIIDNNNISHSTIALGPKQSIRLRLHIILPTGEPSSDYYFSLIFLQTPNTTDQTNTKASIEDQRSISMLQAGIGLNVLLAVGDKQAPQGNIDSFNTPWFQESGPIPFTLTVFNDGLHFITPNGEILIKNMFDQTVGKVTIPPSVILAGTGRNIASTSSSGYANNLSSSATNTTPDNSPQLIWTEGFLFGMYSATLLLALSDQGPIYSRTIHFFVFPLNFLIGAALIIVAAFLVYLKIRKKIS